MNVKILFCFLFFNYFNFVFSQNQISYVDFVNPLMGTQSTYELSHEKTYLYFEKITNGGLLYFEMSDKPNKNGAFGKDALPYSLSNED